MRVIYGAFAQGQGHFSKAAVLVPLLEARGHDVLVVSSGWETPPKGYAFRRHRHFPGMAYVVANGRTDVRGTVLKWLKEAPQVMRHLWQVRTLVREFQPDLILSDFEPLTASPLLQAKCEVICISRQVALFDRQIPLPETGSFPSWSLGTRKLARTTIRLFTAGADRLFGYHYEPASSRCVPPIIRREIAALRPQPGDHVFVYNHYDTADSGSPEGLIDWANRTGVPVRAYGFPEIPRGPFGRVLFKPPGRDAMLNDLRTARAVFTSAGLTTPLEAFLLNKPVIAVPLPNQWEQEVNAYHLQSAGLARAGRGWDYDLTFELPPPADDHPLRAWLTVSAEQVLDHVLRGTPLEDRRAEPKPQPLAA
jgi:uncharacterized protein (TIGR00661 family)